MGLRIGRLLAGLLLAATLGVQGAAATDDPSVQWEQKVEAAARLLATGESAEAERVLREAIEIARNFEGTDSRLEDTLGLLSVALLQQDKLSQAEGVFEELLVLREQTAGFEDRALFAGRRTLAQAYQAIGHPEIAERFFRRALERTTARLGPEHPMVAAIWTDLGNFLHETGREEEAEQAQRQALRLRELHFGPEHPRVADSLYNLGIALAAREKFAEAEAAYRRALAIEEKRLGPDDPALGAILNNLGGVLDDLGRHEEALSLRRRTLQLWEEAYGSNDSLTGMALTNLARTLRYLDQHEEAEQPLRRAIWIYERVYGADAVQLARPYSDLAAVLLGKGSHWGEAEALAEKALKLQERYAAVVEPDNLAESLRILAALRHRQRRAKDAEALYMQALEVWERAHGEESYAAGLGAWDLAEFYLIENMDGMARPQFERALRLMEKAHGTDHPTLLSLWSTAAHFYAKYGPIDEAERLYRLAIEVGEKRLGADHPRTASIVWSYALFLRTTNRAEEASRLLASKAGAAAEAAAASASPEKRWQGAVEAASLAISAERRQEAEEYYARALEEAENFEALDPRRTRTVHDAAENLLQQRKYAEAEALLRRVLQQEEQRGSGSAEALAFYLNELGMIFVAQERHAEAAPIFEGLLAVEEKELGPDDPRLGPTLNKLATLTQLQGRHRESEALALRAIRVTEGEPELDAHWETALRLLGELYSNDGRFSDAAEAYRRILERREKKYGWDHDITASALPELAGALRRAGRLEEARALEARRKAVLGKPTRPPATSPTAAEQATQEISKVNRDAMTLASRGEYEEAEKLFQRGLALVEGMPGFDAPQVEALYGNYAGMLRRAGRQDDAKEIHLRSMTHFESVAAASDSAELRWKALTAAGANAGMVGRWEDATRLYEQAVQVAETLGPQDKRVIQSLNSLAGAYRVQKRDAEAEQAFWRALSVLERAAEPNVTQTAGMMVSLAGLVSGQGKLEEAEELYRRAVTLIEESLGPEDPMLMGALQGLADVSRKLGRSDEAETIAARAEEIRARGQKP